LPYLIVDESQAITPAADPDLVALDEALTALATLDERKARVVEMRFFGGLKEEEIAIALKVSPRTIRGDWKFAKSWLLRWLTESKQGGKG
jgi:DNA-directed RNA polymerase specialized sigma24 family protein